MFQDLHLHTWLSDGRMSYREALDLASKNGVETIAFTDHDLVPGKKELDQLNKLRNHATKWLIGVEISAGLPKELSGRPVDQLHVIGLFVDPANNGLLEYGEKIVASGHRRMGKMVAALAGFGFKITIEDVLEKATGKTIQRPHLVAALLEKKANIEKIEEFIGIVRDKSPGDVQAKRIYQEVKNYSKAEPITPYRQAFYLLFLSNHAYFPGAYFKEDFSVDLDRAVSLIRNAGGVALLAHWSECRHQFPLSMVEKIFREKRIDGAEIVYDLYRIDLGEESQLQEEQRQIKDLVEKYHLIAGGGSDAHDQAGIRVFSQTKWMAEQTVGMAEKILAGRKVFQDWQTVKGSVD